MPIYDVHCYAVVRVKIEGIEADNMEAAIEEACSRDGWYKQFDEFVPDRIRIEGATQVEYAEEINGFLVDVHGDTEYSKSCLFKRDGTTVDYGSVGSTSTDLFFMLRTDLRDGRSLVKAATTTRMGGGSKVLISSMGAITDNTQAAIDKAYQEQAVLLHAQLKQLGIVVSTGDFHGS